MSLRLFVIEVIAVIAGAIIGTLVVDLLSFVFAENAAFTMLASLGRLLIALVTVGLFAFYYSSMPPTPAALASFFTGVGLPAVIEKFGFDTVFSWGTILFLYAVFALVALFTYRFVHANGTVRKVAADVTGRDGTSS